MFEFLGQINQNKISVVKSVDLCEYQYIKNIIHYNLIKFKIMNDINVRIIYILFDIY